MKSVFERLLKHCVDVYSGKIGRNGMPYILHPLEVMNKVVSLPEKIVALAHDYGEFRDVSELKTIGVQEVLLDKIKLLAKTFPDDVHEDDSRYCEYIWNLLADPVCCEVKYADLMVNNGYEDSPAGDGRRFTGLYPHAMALLSDAVEGKLYFNSRTPYLDIFSNFHDEPLKIEGEIWKSGEHYYQTAKFAKNGLQEDEAIYRIIADAETPVTSKKLADEYLTEENKARSHQALRTFQAMATMLNVKFAPGTLARKRLMQTGDLELVHLSGSDFFWGQNRKGTGNNLLGKALMQMRDSIGDCSIMEMMSHVGV
ncbi:MAG: NADAR family protein [Lentisphaeria bacterium]|nr:NADAR family protein [Lentisphaeria bacterium]